MRNGSAYGSFSAGLAPRGSVAEPFPQPAEMTFLKIIVWDVRASRESVEQESLHGLLDSRRNKGELLLKVTLSC